MYITSATVKIKLINKIYISDISQLNLSNICFRSGNVTHSAPHVDDDDSSK